MTSFSGTLSITPARTPLRRAHALLVAVVAAVLLPLLIASPAGAVTQSAAESQLRAADISWTSSGGCTTQTNASCTSFSGIRQATIDGAITLKSASGCGLTITGGTEVGHAGGTYSHETGYKLDFSRTTCLTSWVQNTYAYQGLRSDGAPLYKAGSGNLYADEGNHWDVLFYTCGC